ncbi:MAG: trigger factor [Phycisphaerae bacterium]
MSDDITRPQEDPHGEELTGRPPVDESLAGPEPQALTDPTPVDENQDLAEDQEEPQDEAGEKPKVPLIERLKERVQVEAEDAGPLRKKLTVTVPDDLLKEEVDEQYKELRRDAIVPGFRRGRAPRRLLEKRFGLEVKDTLLQQLVSNGYLAAVEKLKLKPISDPQIWATEKGSTGQRLLGVQKAIATLDLPDEGPLTFACEVEVQPEFELPPLEGIPVVKPVLTITDADVTAQMDRVRRNLGRFEPVPDQAVQPDDVLYADVRITADGQVLHEHSRARLAARPQVIEGVPLTNLGEVLTGARVGDSRTATGVLPNDYEKAEFRGKEATFEVKVLEIHRLKVPDENEAYYKTLGFDSLDEFRSYVRNEMESELNAHIHRGMQGQIQKYLLDNVSLDLPEQFSNQQVNQVVVRRMVELYNQGYPPAEVEKQMDELRTVAREKVARDLKLAFIMEKLAEQIEVHVTEGEMNGMISMIAQRQNRRFDRVRDELMKEGSTATLYITLRDHKILNRLVDMAKITEKTPEAGENPSPEGSPAAAQPDPQST